MKFIRLYHLGNSTVVEIFPDMYIEWQPKTEQEIKTKLNEFKHVEQRIQKKCVVVIDCDKTIYIDKLNFILLLKMIDGIQFDLSVIMKNCNMYLKTLVGNLKLRKNIKVYFNDIY